MSEMVVSQEFEIEGVLEKIQTVGYKSPYILVVSNNACIRDLNKFTQLDWKNPCKIEIHGDFDMRKRLDKLLGKQIRIKGIYEIHPSIKAKPGSEAEHRFVGGIIPPLHFFVAKELSRID